MYRTGSLHTPRFANLLDFDLEKAFFDDTLYLFYLFVVEI
jgi:hypothetical protein